MVNTGFIVIACAVNSVNGNNETQMKGSVVEPESRKVNRKEGARKSEEVAVLPKEHKKADQEIGAIGGTNAPPAQGDLWTSLTKEQKLCLQAFENGLPKLKSSSELCSAYDKFNRARGLPAKLEAWLEYQKSFSNELFALAKEAFKALPGVGDIFEQLNKIIGIVCAHALGNLDNLEPVDEKAIEEQMETQAKDMEHNKVIEEIQKLTKTAFDFIKSGPPKAGEEGLQPLTEKKKREVREELLNKITKGGNFSPQEQQNVSILISEIEKLADDAMMNKEMDDAQWEQVSNEMLKKYQTFADTMADKKMDAGKVSKVDEASEKSLKKTVEALEAPCKELLALLEKV